MRKSVIAFAALFAASTIAAPAAANEVSVSVSFADLNLTAPAGAAVLKQRIDAAADRVCARPHIRDLKGMATWETCRTSARAEAVERLSALQASKGLVLATLF